jgi:hypothetical protein
MQYQYKIFYDLAADEWNWLDAHNPIHGQNWRNILLNVDDIKLYDKLAELPDQQAEDYIHHQLLKRQQDSDMLIKFQAQLERQLAERFVLACQAVERLTNKPLFLTEYHFLLTTFPRLPYNYYDNIGEVFVYATLDEHANDPILMFMHECLHFQFHGYWQNNPDSIVSKLSNDKFEILKESLTVILDDELKPLITHIDEGYTEHQVLRQKLHKYWKKHHDFSALVEFGSNLLCEKLT